MKVRQLRHMLNSLEDAVQSNNNQASYAIAEEASRAMFKLTQEIYAEGISDICQPRLAG